MAMMNKSLFPVKLKFPFFFASLCGIFLCNCKWFGNLFCPAIHNDNILVRLVSPISRVLLNRPHHVHSFHHFSKHHMPAVKPRSLFYRDEELGAIGVLASVGHGQPAGAIVLQFEVLIGKLLSVNGAAASAVTSCKISPLEHEIF